MKTFTVALNHLTSKLFKENGCTTMGDWLRVYNAADVAPFIEAFKKMAEQYYTDKIDMCKDAVSISAVSMTYVLELPGAFVTYAEINKKSSNTVVVMVP